MSKIYQLENNEFQLWNDFVNKHPNGTIFHSTTWLLLLFKEIKVYIIEEKGQIEAGVVLVKFYKNGTFGYHIPPYTQYYSPLVHDSISPKEEYNLINKLLSFFNNSGHIDFKLFRGHQSILPYYWKGFEVTVTITHIISGTLENYLNNLNKNKLRELKKMQESTKSGEIIIGHEIEEKELLKLLQLTSIRNGFDAKSTFVKKLVIDSKESYVKKIVIRSKIHGIIAFGFFPYDNKAVYNIINASLRIKDPAIKTINLLLLYLAIEFALSTGRIFDFEGSMLPGVEEFYRLMGGKQVPVYRVQKSSSLRYSLLRAAKQIKNDRKKT